MRSFTQGVPEVGLLLVFLASIGSSQGVRVNGPLAHAPGIGGEDVVGFQINPEGSWAVFFADSELEEDRFELFSAPIDGSGSARRLNGPLVDGGVLVAVGEYPFPPYGYYVYLPHLEVSVTNRVVYHGDQDVDEVYELYSAPIDGSAPPVKLSGAMVPGGDVSSFTMSPDGMHVLFRADREADGVLEFSSVPIDGSEPPVTLPGTMIPGGGAPRLTISPDGMRAVFMGDLDTNNVRELYSVPTDGSASPIRLNGPLVAGGGVADFQISPDGTQVVYRADEETNNLIELWRTPIDGMGPSVRVSGPIDPASYVAPGYSISPDGTRVVYRSVEHADGIPRHYSAALVGTPDIVALYDPPSPAQGLFQARISPDGAHVVFRGDYAEDEVEELFVVPIDGGAAPDRLSDPLVAGGGVVDFRFSPDGSFVVYWADQVTVDVMELWSVPIAGSEDPVRINGDLVPGGDAAFPCHVSPDGQRVVYAADQREGRGRELWSAPSAGGAAPIRLSGPMANGGNVHAEGLTGLHTGFDVASDGGHVVYIADQLSNDLFSLWSVPLDCSRPPRELNAPLDPGPVLGDVTAFAWTPDGARLVYAADQYTDERSGIHSAELDPHSIFEPIPNVSLGVGSVFELSPDSGWVAYRRQPVSPDGFSPAYAPFYGAPVDGSLPGARWNPSLGGYAIHFTFDPGSEHAVFVQYANGWHYLASGLFSFAVHGGTEAVSLTEPAGMLPEQDPDFLPRFVLSPDVTRVVFKSSFGGGDTYLWSVLIDRSLAPSLLLCAPGIDTFQVSPDGQWVVFVADLDTDDVFEPYRVRLSGGMPPQRLGEPLPIFGDVDPAFRILPDGSRALVVADYEEDDVFELWSVPLEPLHGAVPVRISAKPMPGGGVALGEGSAAIGSLEGPQAQFQVSPVARRVVYRSDERVPGQYELFSAPLDGSSPPVRLSPDLAGGEEVPVFGYRLDPLGDRVVFAAPDGGGVLRLHSVPIDGSTPPIPLGGPFVLGGALWSHSYAGVELSFELTPDGKSVVYLADQIADEVFELFVVPTGGGRAARRLSHALVAGGDVRLPGIHQTQAAFSISPDGRRVAYLADQHADEVFELFVSALEPRRLRSTGQLPGTVEIQR